MSEANNKHKIYGGFLRVTAETDGELFVDVSCVECEGDKGLENNMVFAHTDEYRDFFMHSAGSLLVKINNASPC